MYIGLFGKTGQPFRGNNEGLESVNRGMYIESAKLLAAHVEDEKLRRAVEGKAVFTGMSHDIQNDLIASVHEVNFSCCIPI